MCHLATKCWWMINCTRRAIKNLNDERLIDQFRGKTRRFFILPFAYTNNSASVPSFLVTRDLHTFLKWYLYLSAPYLVAMPTFLFEYQKICHPYTFLLNNGSFQFSLHLTFCHRWILWKCFKSIKAYQNMQSSSNEEQHKVEVNFCGQWI